MAGLLCGALSGIGAIDADIYRRVREANGFDLESYASRLASIK
jgi:ADP-ribosylglycohydrolase